MKQVIPLVLLVGSGCWGGEPDAPLRRLKSASVLGPPTAEADAPPTYQFQFREPTNRTFRVGEPIPCRFTLTVPEGATPPSAVILQIFRGKTFADTKSVDAAAEPVDGVYPFEAEIKAPRVPGRYQLRAEAIRSVLYQGGPPEDNMRIARTHSPRIDLVITKD